MTRKGQRSRLVTPRLSSYRASTAWEARRLWNCPGEPPAVIARSVFVSAMTYGQKPQAIECFEDAALVRTDVPVILADQAKR